MSGFGTVITGTLFGGSLRVGDTIAVQPSGLSGRIRGLQSYKQAVEIAYPGSRVAVNLTGIDRAQVGRGDVLTLPDQLVPTGRIDVRFRHLPSADRPLKHDSQVKVFVGTAETTARVRLLNDDALNPGAEGWLQFELERPLAVSARDRLIVRAPSPSQTIGGGVIVDTHPLKRWRRFQPAVIASLQMRFEGTPAERLAQAATVPSTPKSLIKSLACAEHEFERILTDAQAENLIVSFSDGSILSMAAWQSLRAHMLGELQRYHTTYPLRLGIPREELRSQLSVKSAVISLYLERLPEIVADREVLRLSDHVVRFDYTQQQAVERLLVAMQSVPPPSFTDALSLAGDDVLRALIDLDEIIRLSADVIVARAAYTDLTAAVLATIDAHGSITAASLRDQLNTSRKFAIALLEHMDSIGLTRRQGDARVRR